MDSNKVKKVRSSNLELYRIIVMYLIVIHHYVVNSGITTGIIQAVPEDTNTYIAQIFGMWGKTGINCFMLITGYFMCTSTITLNKFFKLLCEIYFYKIIIFCIFLLFGYEQLTINKIIKLMMPITYLQKNFTGCFIAFFLFIPFLNNLIRALTKKMHLRLIVLCITLYTILDFLPGCNVDFSYVTWFMVIYFIASYIRLYPIPKNNDTKFWGIATFISITLSILSVVLPNAIFNKVLFWIFISDSNAPLALIVSVCSFMLFKNINLKYNKWINIIGGSTFGVLLIHANSNAMREWLWKDLCQNTKYFESEYFIVHILATTIIIFVICVIIDRIRILYIEQPLMKLVANKIDKLSDWLEKSKF